MSDWLLTEAGDDLLQEDGSSTILLEDAVATDNSADWGDGVTISVQVALSAQIEDAGVWDTSDFNVATWGPDIVWTEIGAYCRAFSTKREFDRDIGGAWNAGSASVVLDNRDGRFSPSNLSGPYVAGGISGVRPRRPIRIRAIFDNLTYDLFTGYVLAWEESYGGAEFGATEAVVTVPCTDEFGRLASFTGPAQVAQGLLEFAGRRVNRILDNAGHTGGRDVALGVVPLLATDLSQNAVSELKVVADSEGGAVWVDVDGTIAFEDAYGLIEGERSSNVQATFGDDNTDVAESKYAECVLEYSGDLVTNIVNFAIGGVTASETDNASRALYGDAAVSRTDLLCVSTAHLTKLAQLYLATHKDPEQLITQISVAPRRDPDVLFPQVLSLKVRDLIEVFRRPVGGYELDKLCYIAGVSHTVTPRNWRTDFSLWSASVYQDFFTSQWDEGTFDDALFFY